EVSRLVLRSRPAAADAGSEIVVSGGHAEPVAPCGCPIGTAIEVHNLFFNTPVRRKFLRTPQTEMGHAAEAFTRVALAFPNIQFKLRQNDKTVYELPPVTAWSERIAAIFGGELADALIPVESVDDAVRLTGYAAHPSQTRSHPRMQYVLLNGRAIRDRALQHALSEAYRGLVLSGRYPIAFLRIEMPPEAVDVNVHPTKLEVRFADSGRLYSQLLGTLRTKFLTVDLNTKLRPTAPTSAVQLQPQVGISDPTFAMDESQMQRQRDQLVAWAKGELAGQSGELPTSPVEPWLLANDQSDSARDRKPLELVRIDRSQFPAHLQSPTAPVGSNGAERTGQSEVRSASEAIGASAGHRPEIIDHSPVPAMQVHNRYLIAESNEGVIVIDQHALHERILYEQLRERVLAGTLETQRLLVPETVDLSPAEAATALANADLLAKLGVEVGTFGGDTVLVTSYPAMLANFRPADVLRDLVARLLAEGKAPDRRDLVDELLHMIACKAAIKAGDRLSAEEVAALIEMRHLAQDSHHCPHGRPTALVFTREELDRQFLRT
ncbi:MAG TPA: DNA mismatch repair endonuclease MutL, partial [Pirellulales bacterium]|nr:DNA mismatch repair endonuclease MutL [Pirellulales bacterium]